MTVVDNAVLCTSKFKRVDLMLNVLTKRGGGGAKEGRGRERGRKEGVKVGSVRSGEQVRREAEETPGPLSSCHQAAQQEMPRKLREESCGPSSLPPIHPHPRPPLLFI